MKLRHPFIFAGPPSGKGWLEVRNAAAAEGPAEILIYEQIGKDWWDGSGVQAKDFAEALKAIPVAQEIVVSINSPGGNVWDGLAIYHQLKARGEKVTTRVDGIAASIASVIAMAGRKVVMPKNALMMIHDPSGIVMGTAADFLKMAAELEKIGANLADIYAQKTGKTVDEIRALMLAETWFTGEEAQTFGLADQLTEEVKMAATFNLSAFRNVPATLKSTQQPSAKSGAGQENTIMNKAAILALLAKHGVVPAQDAADTVILAELEKLVSAGKVTTDEKSKAVAPPSPAPAPAPTNVVPLAEFQALQAQVQAERASRITAKLDAMCAQNPNIDRQAWLPRVLRDETLMADLAKIPNAAADPLRPTASDAGNPLAEKYRAMKPGAARAAFRQENEADIRRLAPIILNAGDMHRIQRTFAPQDANTLAAALITDYLADGVIVVAANKLAPLSLFTRLFSADPMKPRATVQVNKATVGATAATNAANFETGDTTLAATAVTMNQITQAFHLTNDQLNKGYQLGNLIAINADTFANAISDVWTALALIGTYGAGLVVGLQTAFDPGDLPPIFNVAKNFRQRNLILDGGYMGALFPGIFVSSAFQGVDGGNKSKTVFPGMYGFDNIAMQNRWTSATANTVGFACGVDAIVMASALPIGQPAGEFLSMQAVTIDGGTSADTSIALTVQACTWYSRATRTIWASFDVLFGAAAGDAGSGKNLLSA